MATRGPPKELEIEFFVIHYCQWQSKQYYVKGLATNASGLMNSICLRAGVAFMHAVKAHYFEYLRAQQSSEYAIRKHDVNNTATTNNIDRVHLCFAVGMQIIKL